MSFELREAFGLIDFLLDEGRGAKLLPEFLKYSPNVIEIINAIMPEIQELHDAQADVYSTINIFEAVGSQLDDIFGNILNTPRIVGQTDEEYRADLLVAVARFARSGDIVTLKNIYRSIMQASSVDYYEYQPHEFRMYAQVASIQENISFTLSDGPGALGSPFGLSDGIGTGGYLVDSTVAIAAETAAKLEKARSALTEAKQGGVRMSLVVNSEVPFTLTDLTTPQLNSPLGLTDGTFDGGTLSILF